MPGGDRADLVILREGIAQTPPTDVTDGVDIYITISTSVTMNISRSLLLQVTDRNAKTTAAECLQSWLTLYGPVTVVFPTAVSIRRQEIIAHVGWTDRGNSSQAIGIDASWDMQVSRDSVPLEMMP